MSWDIAVRVKVYQRLANELFFRVCNGIYPLGSKLPTFPQIAKEAGSSPETVRKAVSYLRERGVIDKTTYGYFITSEQARILAYRDSYLASVEQEYIAGKQKIAQLNTK